MMLTGYYREEFGKFRTFLTKKVPKLESFGVKLVNFRVKKVVLGVCNDRYTSAVIG